MLTLKKLKEMKPDTIFAKGTFNDFPDDINIAGTGKNVRWIACRGYIEDWCIYCQNPHYINSNDLEVVILGMSGVWSWEQIQTNGDKISYENHIRKLVPCTDEAFKMYRY